jgi:hypothetical protein
MAKNKEIKFTKEEQLEIARFIALKIWEEKSKTITKEEKEEIEQEVDKYLDEYMDKHPIENK